MGSEDQQRKAKQELQLLMIALHGTLRYQLRARNRTARAESYIEQGYKTMAAPEMTRR